MNAKTETREFIHNGEKMIARANPATGYVREIEFASGEPLNFLDASKGMILAADAAFGFAPSIQTPAPRKAMVTWINCRDCRGVGFTGALENAIACKTCGGAGRVNPFTVWKP